MQICIIDGEQVNDRETLHDVLKASLKLPDWYGRNLDALYDCLTDMQEETQIRILHEELLKDHLGSYAVSLVGAIRSAARDNSRLQWETDALSFRL